MRTAHRYTRLICTTALVCMLASPGIHAQESNAELLAKLESMQQQIDELRQQLEQTQTQTTETDAKVEAVAEVVESGSITQPQEKKTTIAGYGELHYNSLSAEDPSYDVDEIDFHRFVLFFGHEFNDKTRFYSEFELEHALAGDGKPGEVELEQAFIEFDLKQDLYAKAGLFLIPVGILNETHEPPTFYGVERNSVENIIIPSTWWEAGAGMNGRWGSGWNWDLALTSGLAIPTTGSNAFRVRSGRQKVAEALASDGAITGRLRYLGIPGLQAAVTMQYQFDPSQEANDGLDDGTLVSFHGIWNWKLVQLRALWAQWNFNGELIELADADRHRPAPRRPAPASTSSSRPRCTPSSRSCSSRVRAVR